ncbi:complement C1q tumor necrosis factor-related protein 1 [Polypterus senegalus]|uniref:complement C1q tumor necrosis factor-related protein 1 n=1 Tax=Polypterus senegalus TaxID=55291 RepID=UPI001966060D|nr:complement C1q tumor necrosis factor-related protein 1 [Polypterus senegalus]
MPRRRPQEVPVHVWMALLSLVMVQLCIAMVTDPSRTAYSKMDLGDLEDDHEYKPTEANVERRNRGEEGEEEEGGGRFTESTSPPLKCQRCCDFGEQLPPPPHPYPYPAYQVVPQINITILKGEKGSRGERGHYGKAGKSGNSGPRGATGIKGNKGSIGIPGEPCKTYYSAFSVGRKKGLHSNEYYQVVVFDTEFVNLYRHFNMFTGKFYCYIPGVYFFSLNAHTWNQKETYLHLMKNEQEVVILYAQPSDRSIMQSQSLMLELEEKDEVWVRLFKGERENAIFSDDFDTYITFSGYLIKAKTEV